MKTHALPGQPMCGDEPVFCEPWEAHAFAMAVTLHQRGLFTWTEWAAALSAQIAKAQQAGDADLGDTYYRHWLDALERLVIAKGLADADRLHARLEQRTSGFAGIRRNRV